MAKMRGAYVITTCSERNIDFVKSLGIFIRVFLHEF